MSPTTSSSTVDYAGYRAHSATRRSPWRAAASAAWRFVKQDLGYNTLLYPYGMWRHARLVREAPRSQRHTYTCFLRAPLQLQALTGPVLARVSEPADATAARRRLRVLVFACSNGAEAYTLASALLQADPSLDLEMEASDLHQEMIDKATAGRYGRDEVLHSPYMTPAFAEATFDREGDTFVVKAALRERVRFRTADLLAPDLPAQFAPADLVLAQNVLFHLPPDAATQALRSLHRLLRPRGALAIEGADTGLKLRLTRELGLAPLPWNVRAIYEQSRVHVSAAWWRYYYGSEPYAPWRLDKARRYGSIFLKG
jgi:chemotaxis methyl-accepting protein methylase